jgi:endogenous inhibitor of DNA gyrase (YacG/DUF329 family)
MSWWTVTEYQCPTCHGRVVVYGPPYEPWCNRCQDNMHALQKSKLKSGAAENSRPTSEKQGWGVWRRVKKAMGWGTRSGWG